MNAIGKWKNPKKYLPTIDKTVLICLGDYEYDVVRLNASDDGISFLSEKASCESHDIEDVKAWCYIDLDEVEA